MKSTSTMDLPGAPPKAQAAQPPLPPNKPPTKVSAAGADDGLPEGYERIGAGDLIARAGHESIEEINAVIAQKTVNPGVDRKAINLQVETHGEDGKEEAVKSAAVEADKANAGLLAKINGLLQVIQEGLQNIDSAVAPLVKMASGVRPFVMARAHGIPYTWWELTKLVLLFVFLALLLTLSAVVVASNLRSTGIQAFESWTVCLLFSPLALLAVLPIKLIERRITSLEQKERFARFIIIVGGVFMLLTIWFFSILFPGMTIGADQIIDSALSGKGDGIPNWMRRIYVAVQLTAEACLSAACWMEIESTIAEHQVYVPQKNPALIPIEREVQRYKKHEFELKRGLRELAGKLKEFQDMKQSLINETVRIYDAQLLVAKGNEKSRARAETILNNY